MALLNDFWCQQPLSLFPPVHDEGACDESSNGSTPQEDLLSKTIRVKRNPFVKKKIPATCNNLFTWTVRHLFQPSKSGPQITLAHSQYPYQHPQQPKMLNLELPLHSLRPQFLRIVCLLAHPRLQSGGNLQLWLRPPLPEVGRARRGRGPGRGRGRAFGVIEVGAAICQPLERWRNHYRSIWRRKTGSLSEISREGRPHTEEKNTGRRGCRKPRRKIRLKGSMD